MADCSSEQLPATVEIPTTSKCPSMVKMHSASSMPQSVSIKYFSVLKLEDVLVVFSRPDEIEPDDYFLRGLLGSINVFYDADLFLKVVVDCMVCAKVLKFEFEKFFCFLKYYGTTSINNILQSYIHEPSTYY